MENTCIYELLLAAVEKRTVLYDKTEDNYSNRVYINRQWIEIGNELGINGNAARKKWTTLRDYFYKSNKPLKTIKSGAAADKRKEWYLYDSMKFLLPHITDRRTTSNLSDVSDIEDDDCSQISENSYQSLQLRSVPSSQTFEPTENYSERNSTPLSQVTLTPSPSASASEVNPTQGASSITNIIARPTTSRKRAPCPQERRQKASMDGQILDAILSINRTTQKKKDDCDLFLQSLAPQLRSLNALARYKCQAEIQMLILRNLDQSQVSNAPFIPTEGQHQQSVPQQFSYNTSTYQQYQTYSP